MTPTTEERMREAADHARHDAVYLEYQPCSLHYPYGLPERRQVTLIDHARFATSAVTTQMTSALGKARMKRHPIVGVVAG